MKNFLLAAITLASILFNLKPVCSQDVKWNTAPKKGFVYQITNREAEKLLTGKYSGHLQRSLLHTFIDTFNVHDGWNNRPSKGHFILVTVEGTKLRYEYKCVFPYQVFLLKEYNAMALQVVDPDGNVRDDARVMIGLHRLAIDTESKTYRVENETESKEEKYVTVELFGFRSVFNVTKNEIPTWYDNGDDYDQGPSFFSYLLTDKNKYRPNDKIRFKSYALSHLKVPLRKELDIWLVCYPRSIKMGTLAPYRPGGYSGEFRLNDSLKLSLDKNYRLELRDKNSRVVSSCSFRYEDYELTGNRLTVKVREPYHYFPDGNQVTITATDANGMILKDAKADILIRTNIIFEAFKPLVVLPDTLFFKHIELDPGKPTVIDIPTSLFKETNTSYDVVCTVLNSQNQRMENTETAYYYYSNYFLSASLSHDSIYFDFLKNNISVANTVVSMKTDQEKENRKVILPYKEKLNPAIRYYHFENDLIKRDIPMNSLNPEVRLEGGIEKDSFKISLVNPQQLNITWFVYQGSFLVNKGFGSEMEFKTSIEDRSETFYVELLYSFAGQDQAIRRQFEMKDDYLDVALDIPERIYPGQQVNAAVTVSDQHGKPVRNVDLTAMAVSGKLDYYVPDLSYFGRSSEARPKGATYDKDELDLFNLTLKLDYKKWEPLLRLDTMLFYQFMYPSPKGFIKAVPCSDSTQFTVFVMKDGTARQIHVIELDRRPVYYSWTNQPKGYSFYVAPGRRHEITLRMPDEILILDSLSFERNKKTIISLDLKHLPPGIKVLKAENHFSQTEINRHTAYTCKFKNITRTYAYLQSPYEFVPLFSRVHTNNMNYYYNYVMAGPVLPERKTYVENDLLKTTYRHEGGYQYAFEDNIVYKNDATDLVPKTLFDNEIDPVGLLGEAAINKTAFLDGQKINPRPYFKWLPEIIDLKGSASQFKAFLPVNKDSTGIAAVLFENPRTKKMTAPSFNKYFHAMSSQFSLPLGLYSFIVMYDDGSYVKTDSILFRNYSNIALNLSGREILPADEFSMKWLKDYLVIQDFDYVQKAYPLRIEKYYYQNGSGNISGTVYDGSNEPLPGATIMIKGTKYGAVTDLDGSFSLHIDGLTATLTISFVGFESKDVEVTRGSTVFINLEESVLALQEVVVVGYGTTMRAELTGAVAGLSIMNINVEREKYILPEEKEEDLIIHDSDKHIYQELMTLNSLRRNFSDVGFWEPRLFTDNRGRSEFKVTFPDDITRWNAVVYAMNKVAQTGTGRKIIKSYKPIMAELNVPGFLTVGDSSLFLGKVTNYATDSLIRGKVQWELKDSLPKTDVSFSQYHTDYLPVVATATDSITTRYTFRRDDGYMDGEERTIPVEAQGIDRKDGDLSVLKNGDKLDIAGEEGKNVTVTILDDQVKVYAGEIDWLIHYRFDCNEQLASKLIGLISYKMLMEFEGKPFKRDADIKTIIRRLLRNQNKDFMWSWWDVSDHTSSWISAHVLEALRFAKDAGYPVDLDIANITRKAQYNFDFLKQFSDQDIELVNVLARWNAPLNYAKYLPALDSVLAARQRKYRNDIISGYYPWQCSFLKEKLCLQEIRQLKGLQYQRDTLMKYKKEGMLGDVFFSDNKQERYWYTNNLAANMIAYRIIRNDSLLSNLEVPMQMHFIHSHQNGWNTCQSSDLVMTILPDLLKEGYSKDHIASVVVSGKENKTVSHYPYTVELKPGEVLHLQKETGIPLFVMKYVNEHVTTAHTGKEGFRINAAFDDNTLRLEAGKIVELVVEVNVLKDSPAENVMIEVPIPAACSYADKGQRYYGVETHREYFKEKTVIFCEKMDPGKYSFTIRLLPRFTGKYFVNPSQVSLMYIPVVNANTDMKRVEVE
jgi:alpha-2-macroglobulin